MTMMRAGDGGGNAAPPRPYRAYVAVEAGGTAFYS